MRLLSTALLAAALAAALPATAQKIQSAPLRIMPLGDSITEGGDGFGGYRRPLFDKITAAIGMPNFVGGRNLRDTDPADFVDGDQDGYSAYRIDQIMTGKGFWKAPTIEQRLLDWDPAVVLLHGGTNDAQQDYYFDGDPAQNLRPAIDRLDALVTRIVRFNPQIYIVVAQIIPANAPATDITQDYIVRLDAQIPAMVAKHQAHGDRVTMVDMYTPMVAIPNPDGIHPGPEGYGVMADVWFAGLQALNVVPVNPDPGRFAGIHQVDRWSSTSSTPWTLGNSLIRAGSPTLASAATTDYTGRHSPALLNDGNLKGGTTDDKDFASTSTYTLDTAAAPAGYDIAQIRTEGGLPLSDSGDESAHQSYEIWIATVDAPDAFAKLGAFHHIMVNKTERASQIDLTPAAGATLATHVAKVQFRFTQPPRRQYGFIGIGTPTPYRELEVFGAPSMH